MPRVNPEDTRKDVFVRVDKALWLAVRMRCLQEGITMTDLTERLWQAWIDGNVRINSSTSHTEPPRPKGTPENP